MFQRNDKPIERTAVASPNGVSLEDLSEEGLVALLRALDDAAWAEAYRRHAQQIYQYAYHRLGDQHAAEDLSADVFVKAIAGIGRYQFTGTPLLAWLYRIAHNVTADYRRNAAKRAQRTASIEAEGLSDYDDRLHESDERHDMMTAIRSLTEEQQQVVILRFYEGLSIAEVSSVVGKPEGAVKALQARGLRSLRRLLNGARQGVDRESA